MDANYFHKIIYGRPMPEPVKTRPVSDVLSEVHDISRDTCSAKSLQELLEGNHYALDKPARLVGD